MICTWKNLMLVMDGTIFFMTTKNIWKDLEKKIGTISLLETCQVRLKMKSYIKVKIERQWWKMKVVLKRCKNICNFKNSRLQTILSRNVLCCL